MGVAERPRETLLPEETTPEFDDLRRCVAKPGLPLSSGVKLGDNALLGDASDDEMPILPRGTGAGVDALCGLGDDVS